MGTNSFLSIEPPQLGGRSSDEGVLLEISVYADPMSDQLVGDGLPWGDVKSWRCSSEQGVDHLNKQKSWISVSLMSRIVHY